MRVELVLLAERHSFVAAPCTFLTKLVCIFRGQALTCLARDLLACYPFDMDVDGDLGILENPVS